MGEINGSTLYLLFWFLCMSNHWQLTFIELLCKHIILAKMLETRLLLLDGQLLNRHAPLFPKPHPQRLIRDAAGQQQHISVLENSILTWQTKNLQLLMKVNMPFNENDLLQLSHRCFSFMGCLINHSEWLTGLTQKIICPQPVVSFFI